MFPFMTGILFRHIEYFYSMYESPWSFPLIRYTWMLDAFPSKTLWRGKKRLLLSVLHCYSLTFQYKCTSDTKGVPPQVILPRQTSESSAGVRRLCAPGFPALWEGEKPNHTFRAQWRENHSLLYSLCRKHGCQYATMNRFWTWPCKAIFRYTLKGVPWQGGGLQEMVCG